jgi:hypothetical protein
MVKKARRVTRENTVTDFVTGEVTVQTREETIYHESESDFVKFYTAGRSLIGELPGSAWQLLCELLGEVGYDHRVNLLPYHRKELTVRLGLQPRTFDWALSQLLRAQVLFRLGRGTYELNPWLIGKGPWPSIVRLRQLYELRDGAYHRLTD